MSGKREDGRRRPRKLSKIVMRLIVERAIRERNKPRDYLADELIKEIEENGDIAPTPETMKRYISKARNSTNPKDKIWTIGACEEFDSYFPPDSLPTIYESINLIGQSLFTIRQMIWLIRLKPLVQKIFSRELAFEEASRIGIPILIADYYAFAELTSEILGENQFDTQDLDQAFFSADIGELAKRGIIKRLKSSKQFECNSDCESCKYEPISSDRAFGLGNLCKPKHKEGE